MKKTLLLLILLNTLAVFAQNDRINFGLMSADQQFIKAATDSALFILRQDYVMRDTALNEDLTLDNQNFFGRNHMLAVMVNGVLLTDARIFQPWLNDTNFVQYSENYGLQPVNTTLSIRSVNESNFSPINYEIISLNPETDSLLSAHSLLILKSQNQSSPSLTPVFNTTDSNGWVLFVYSDENIELSETTQLKFAIFKGSPDFFNNAKLTKQPEINNIIGGVYLVPRICTGNIMFNIGGFVRKAPIINWYVKVLPEIITTDKTETNKPVDNEHQTPQSKKQKKKKK